MSNKGYFGKIKTGGSNSSIGFAYQDLCAAFYFLKHLNVSEFNSIGIETDDDFSLLFDNKKINVQVKYEELSIPIVKKYICENQIVLGPSKNKSLSTLLSYLNQYRNNKFSSEDLLSKISVSEDFRELLKRNGIAIENVREIPNTWSVDVLPEDKIKEIIKLEMIEWGIDNSLLLDADECLKDLIFIIYESRSERGYIERSDITNIFKKHSKKLILKEEGRASLNFLENLDLEPSEILSSVNSKVSKAENFLIDGHYEEALREYVELSKAVKSEKLYIKCAGILQILGEIDDAILYCDNALKINPLYAMALAVKGTLVAEKGDDDFALELLKSAEFQDNTDPFIIYNVGVAYLNLRSVDEAVSYFEKTIELNSNLSSPHLNLGVCYFNKGVFSEAAKHIDLALLLEPGLPEALSQKGEIKRFYGEVDEATKLFERCLLNTPDNLVANLGLAFCLIEKGDPLGFGHLVLNYQKQLSELEVDKSLVIVDIGWERTLSISIKNIDRSSYLVNYDGLEVYVPKPKKDRIAIGVLSTQHIELPLIMKSYTDLNSYKNAVNAIKLSQPIDLFVSANGFVNGKSDHCEIKIDLQHYSIYGKTDKSDNKGYRAFIDCFDGWFLLVVTHDESKQQESFNVVGLECN
ncbi:tetratricopeptide repeat protein [Marinobacter nauticus]|uniref:tetratricopeptide repeat protein n=1 Tax=Marinobacter nauticus TaxID=2743 RepID=UPI001CFCEF86|nr:tetratricopeptide repeat protein [Marinobacter nauticus]